MKHFFKLIPTKSDKNIKYTLRKPSQILLKNIHVNWLQYMHMKTHKQMPVYINSSKDKISESPVYGIIKQNLHEYNNDVIVKHNVTEYSPEMKSTLLFKIFVPHQDTMQYFIKWQRYRKYWWSSISTTPSLFTISDIKNEDDTANVDIVAQLSCGRQPVESITIQTSDNDPTTTCLSCKMSLEPAIITLLLDGLTNNSRTEYLRLHRKIAPYKISFGLDCKDTKQKKILSELATLMHHRLESKKISSWLPDFTLESEPQITENTRMGVPYTAVLSEGTLGNGIFKLISSSTMLGEQVHLADFDSYAEMIFR